MKRRKEEGLGSCREEGHGQKMEWAWEKVMRLGKETGEAGEGKNRKFLLNGHIASAQNVGN